MTTRTAETYLEIIYMMTVEEQPVIGARLAQALRVSRPTVSATLQRMAREGLIKINSRKEIQMTAKGRAIAERLQHRHRIVERWLTDVLGLDWAKSDAEAHQLEHAMSDQVAELLNKHLGYPTTCPHGNPIPGNPQTTPVLRVIQLGQVNENTSGVVMRISEYAENVGELLDYLGSHGIVPGTLLTVTEIAPMNGPLTLRVRSRTISLSRQVANFIWIKPEQA